MTQEPHPMRCSNDCTFLKVRTMKLHPLIEDDTGIREVAFCMHPSQKDENGYPLAISHHVWIKRMGCASHSNHPVPTDEDIRQDEREKVLDEIAKPIIRLSERMEEEGDYVSQSCFEDVLKIIAELRSGKQEAPR